MSGASLTLAWDPNLEPDIAGYKLYYGTASGRYTSAVIVGTNIVGNAVTATVSNLTAGTTYFFVVTAFNGAGLESDPSSEVTNTAPWSSSTTTGGENHSPVLTAVANQSGLVQAAIVASFVASDPDSPASRLTFSLDPGAPPGARIDPVTGLFMWFPARQQARSTNLITVRVTDDGVPPLSATQVFTVIVGDSCELSLGTNIVLAGKSGCVTIAVHSATPVVRMTFQVDVPVSGLTDFAVQPESQFISATLRTNGPNRFDVSLLALAGQFFSGTQALASLCFRAEPDKASALIPLRVSRISAVRLGEGLTTRVLGYDGRVVVIKSTPMLEAVQGEAQRRLCLYAPPGPNFTVQWAPSLAPHVLWSNLWSGPVTNLVQIIIPPSSANSFYRTTSP
jgi:hypothetical protein